MHGLAYIPLARLSGVWLGRVSYSRCFGGCGPFSAVYQPKASFPTECRCVSSPKLGKFQPCAPKIRPIRSMPSSRREGTMRYLAATLMKHLLTIVFVVFVSVTTASAFAEQYVHGYFRSSGTYVQPYYRSSPNGTVRDNYSYLGNVNPHTGKVGENRYLHDRTSPYYQGPDSHGRIGHNSASNQLGEPLSQGEWVPMRQSTVH
jgi:hypothetical protein